jgi:hypothetical protein
VLWFRPTVADATSVTTADVESRHLPALSNGQDEPSLTAARQFVHSMVAEQQAAQAAAHPPAAPKPPPQTKARTTTPSTT